MKCDWGHVLVESKIQPQYREVERSYDLSSATYDEDHASRTSTEITAVEEIVVMSLLRNISFYDVLDAGTGTGRYAIRLARDGKHVAGIDVSAQMLAQAQSKGRATGAHHRPPAGICPSRATSRRVLRPCNLRPRARSRPKSGDLPRSSPQNHGPPRRIPPEGLC